MSDPFVGEIRMFAGPYAPQNWAFCAGQVLAISEYDALFSLIGVSYGGDGRVNFALPDLRGRVPMGQGTGPGLTPRVLAQKFGTEAVTLTQEQMPTHSHSFVATTATATSGNPAGGLIGDTVDDVFYVSSLDNPQLQGMNSRTVLSAGGSQSHSNIMPSVAMNYIICLFGIYPSRS